MGFDGYQRLFRIAPNFGSRHIAHTLVVYILRDVIIIAKKSVQIAGNQCVLDNIFARSKSLKISSVVQKSVRLISSISHDKFLDKTVFSLKCAI